MPKDAFWFSHDSNARNDPRILDMRSKYGSQGYGWYWMIVEMLREQSDYKLKQSKCNAYAMQMNCQPDAVAAFIADCVDEYRLFSSDGEFFWSNSLLRRMENKDRVSEARQKAAQKRWSDANAMQMQCINDANAMLKEEKRKEEKTEEEKEVSPPKLSPADLADAYHRICTTMPRMREFTEARKAKARVRINEHPDIAWWEDVFGRAAQTPFCCGKNDRGWKADFDWFVENDKNAVKVLEGKYGAPTTQQTIAPVNLSNLKMEG